MGGDGDGQQRQGRRRARRVDAAARVGPLRLRRRLGRRQGQVQAQRQQRRGRRSGDYAGYVLITS